MGMTVSGLVKKIFETKQVSERFSKREFVVEVADNPRYPQLVLFEATNERCAVLDSASEGDTVSIDFELRGREWKSPNGEVKYFNTLSVWKLAVTQKAATPPPAVIANGANQDDIPF